MFYLENNDNPRLLGLSQRESPLGGRLGPQMGPKGPMHLGKHRLRVWGADACGGVIFLPSSWEPQEEGMMNIAASFFPQLRNQGMSIRRGRSQYD
jgi:hypothetical protein